MVRDISYYLLIISPIIGLIVYHIFKSRRFTDCDELYAIKQFNRWHIYYLSNDETVEKLMNCETVQSIYKIIEWEKLK